MIHELQRGEYRLPHEEPETVLGETTTFLVWKH